jgi:hypothetical protein
MKENYGLIKIDILRLIINKAQINPFLEMDK